MPELEIDIKTWKKWELKTQNKLMPNKFDSFGTYYSFSKVNEKNPIVFIHGVGLTKEIWYPQINFFKDYNTLAYDLLGHGKTPLKKN